MLRKLPDRTIKVNYFDDFSTKAVLLYRLSTEEFFKYGNFCVCTTPCTEDLFVASVSFSSMSVNLESISGAAKVKMGKLQSRLETAREITYRSVNCRKGRAIFPDSPNTYRIELQVIVVGNTTDVDCSVYHTLWLDVS